MNRRLTKICFLLAAAFGALLPFSCSKAPAGTSGHPVEFSLDHSSTKGQTPITTLAALAAQDFSVSAWYTPEGMTFEAADAHPVAYIRNHRFGYIKASGEDNSYANHSWQGVNRANNNSLSANPVYWPLDGTLSFFCYAPYRANAAAATPPDPDERDIVLEAPVTDDGILSRLPGYLPGSPLIRVTPMLSAAGQADFLCAPALLDVDRADVAGEIPVDFSRHRMTQVTFAFNETGFTYPTGVLAEGQEAAIRVLGITVKGVVGSKYLYFTKTPSRVDCAWSDAVSPADPSGSDLPLADYRILGANGELKTVAAANVPERNAGNDNHNVVNTDKGRLFLLPQTLPATAKLEVNYAIVEKHGVPLVTEIVTCDLPVASLTSWPEGKVVRYLLTLNIPERGVVSMTASEYDWEDSGYVHGEEDLMY